MNLLHPLGEHVLSFSGPLRNLHGGSRCLDYSKQSQEGIPFVRGRRHDVHTLEPIPFEEVRVGTLTR